MDQVMSVGPRRRPRCYVLWLAALVTFAAVSVVLTTGRSTASVARPGYSCLSSTALGARPSGATEVRFDGFELRVVVAPTTSSGAPSASVLVVSGSQRHWVLPKPRDLRVSTLDQLCLVRFHQGAVPDVIMEGFTGGAHCCQQPVFYAFDGLHSRYDKVVDLTAATSALRVAWDANGGFAPMRVGGQILLRTEADHFAYAFGCYACTPMPIQLDTFGAGGLRDVTGQHPLLVAKEAAQLRKLAVAQANAASSNQFVGSGPFGPLAAYVADSCVLGRGDAAWKVVARLQRQGKLPTQLFRTETAFPRGSFATNLRTFLLKDEYCVGQIG